MERKERFKKAFEYLVSKGLAHRQRDIAERMKATSSNVSRAFKGDVAVLTDNFLRRFNAAYNSLFNIDWLLFEQGEMLVPASPSVIRPFDEVSKNDATEVDGDNMLLEMLRKQQALTESAMAQVSRLICILERMVGKTIDINNAVEDDE